MGSLCLSRIIRLHLGNSHGLYLAGQLQQPYNGAVCTTGAQLARPRGLLSREAAHRPLAPKTSWGSGWDPHAGLFLHLSILRAGHQATIFNFRRLLNVLVKM